MKGFLMFVSSVFLVVISAGFFKSFIADFSLQFLRVAHFVLLPLGVLVFALGGELFVVWLKLRMRGKK